MGIFTTAASVMVTLKVIYNSLDFIFGKSKHSEKEINEILTALHNIEEELKRIRGNKVYKQVK